ncbi:hypothetical protein BCR36DRAFT_126137 [Piromyces finnis]|uniref:Uncharacterized protein n=1 Tax=Piromyces finnis TaxID=1754191 RepID=A0A1Y1V060_9FUNG|nr:hypothetical protein BCR36DRAFT_126137 [Piromyces finnis]|eukprot:ORX44481.1 hypothetical protein BCR36DRAFT_126137 [Piromyces finnis]
MKEEELNLIEESLLFKDFVFNKNQFLNFEINPNTKPEIVLLRNLQSEIFNQILQNPKYIYLIFYNIEEGSEFLKSLSYINVLVLYMAFQKHSLYIINMFKKEKYILVKNKDIFIKEIDEINGEHKKRRLNPSLFMERINHQHCFNINEDINLLDKTLNENTDQILYNYFNCFFFNHISIWSLTEILTLKQVKFSKGSFFYLKYYNGIQSKTFQYAVSSIIEEERWIIIFYYELYKHFICLLDYHKRKGTLFIKNLFKGFFSFNYIFPVSFHQEKDIEILDIYFCKFDTFFQNYDKNLLNLTHIEGNSLECESYLFDQSLLIYLLYSNNYIANHGINLFIHSYELLSFINYLRKNYLFLYQDFLKLLLIHLTKVLYHNDYDHLVTEFQMKNNKPIVKDIDNDDVIIIASSKENNINSVEKDSISDKENGFDDDVEDIIIIEENEKFLKDENEIIVIEEEEEEEEENTNGINKSYSENVQYNKEELIISEDEVIEIKETDEDDLSKIINNMLLLLKEINQFSMTLDNNNQYLYPTFIKDYRFINVTKRNAISLFLDIDESFFNVDCENGECLIDFLLRWIKNSFGISFEYHYETSKLEYTIDDQFLKNEYKTILQYFKSKNNNHEKNNKNDLFGIELKIDEEQKLFLNIHCIALFVKDILNESKEYHKDSKDIQKGFLCHRHRYKIYKEMDDTIPLSNSFNQKSQKDKDQMENQKQLMNHKENLNKYKSIDEIVKKLKEIDSLIDVDELKTFSLSSEVINFIEENISSFLSLELRNNHQSLKPYQDFIKKVTML